MQELIEKIELLKKLNGVTNIIDLINIVAQTQLEKEKEQIENAYSIGYGDGVQEPNPNDNYYEQTYNQNK